MKLHVLEIGVLRVLFAFVGHVDQQIESSRVGFTSHDRQELLLVKHHQGLHRLPKQVQKTPAFLADRGLR